MAELRDLLNTSRRYALPLLEYLDAKRITRRVGDKRILGRPAMKSDSRFSWRLGGKYSQLYTDGTYVEVVAPSSS